MAAKRLSTTIGGEHISVFEFEADTKGLVEERYYSLF